MPKSKTSKNTAIYIFSYKSPCYIRVRFYSGVGIKQLTMPVIIPVANKYIPVLKLL